MKNKKSNKPKKVILKKGHFTEFYEQVRKVAPLVLEILKKHKPSRDYDIPLQIRVWKAQGQKENESFKKFKYGLYKGKYSNPETIRRARQKIQENEDYKHLRGKFYKERQKAEAKMKNQLSFWEI